MNTKISQLPSREELLKKLNTKCSADNKVALLFIDIDNFKIVNYTFGYKVGNKLLDYLADLFFKIITDKNNYSLYYMGADEFAVLIEDCKEGSKFLSDLAEDILQELKKAINILDQELTISASIGICIYPNNADSAEGLLQNTDTARYDAKSLGRNTYSFYTKSMRADLKEHSELSNDLRAALKNQEELYICYQPQVDSITGLILGSESLIRWRHPKKGLISPEIFINIAEKEGLMSILGDWILHRVCKDLRELHDEGFSELYAAINLSAEQFSNGDIAGLIAQTIWDYKLEPKYVELELTESMVMKNPEKSLLMLRVLKSMGMELGLDDFGTGYSSLSHLMKFPLNTLKVDQSFTRDLDTKKDNEVITATIIQMAKNLNLKVVVEGVETMEVLRILKEVDKKLTIQGYLYSKPLVFADYKELLIKNKNTPFKVD